LIKRAIINSASSSICCIMSTIATLLTSLPAPLGFRILSLFPLQPIHFSPRCAPPTRKAGLSSVCLPQPISLRLPLCDHLLLLRFPLLLLGYQGLLLLPPLPLSQSSLLLLLLHPSSLLLLLLPLLFLLLLLHMLHLHHQFAAFLLRLRLQCPLTTTLDPLKPPGGTCARDASRLDCAWGPLCLLCLVLGHLARVGLLSEILTSPTRSTKFQQKR
jgi:hypothetical protein